MKIINFVVILFFAIPVSSFSQTINGNSGAVVLDNSGVINFNNNGTNISIPLSRDSLEQSIEDSNTVIIQRLLDAGMKLDEDLQRSALSKYYTSEMYNVLRARSAIDEKICPDKIEEVKFLNDINDTAVNDVKIICLESESTKRLSVIYNQELKRGLEQKRHFENLDKKFRDCATSYWSSKRAADYFNEAANFNVMSKDNMVLSGEKLVIANINKIMLFSLNTRDVNEILDRAVFETCVAETGIDVDIEKIAQINSISLSLNYSRDIIQKFFSK